MSTSKQPKAIRGAISVERDEPDAIVGATEELLEEMLKRNDVASDDVISIIFTATPDLTSEFPAPAARRLGLSDVPLLCAAEIPVDGALARCVRILLHVSTTREQASLRHVYLKDASSLRADLDEHARAPGGSDRPGANPQGQLE